MGACGGGEKATAARQKAAPRATAAAALADPVLNTFIDKSIEIDQLGTGVAPEDANLFTGLDPADSSASKQKPTGGPATFIDWNDLGGDLANHKLADAYAGKDPSSFPLSNECVGSSQVLSKMDLTYVGAANNSMYAYFAVQRANNNGDAGYYWLFTRKTPRQIAGGGPCKADQNQLLYDISGPAAGASGDVLLGGHFHPNGTPLLRVFHATRDEDGVSAVNAIDFTSDLWEEDTAGVSAVAINTTITAPGLWGADGVLALSGANLGPEVFAEAAVPLTVFTGGSACGATFYGSVITRSSGSGGTSPDLKDLSGPALFNFGQPTAAAKLTATCGLSVSFEVTSALGFDGKPIANPGCAWEFDDGSTSSSCSGSIDLPAGSHTASVTVTDPSAPAECAAAVTTAPVTNYEPVTVVPALAASCTNSFTYDATPGGGSGAYSYAWAFSGPSSVSPASSTTKSGTVEVGAGNQDYTAALVLTDAGRADSLVCTASASETVRPFSPLAITLTPSATSLSCPGMTTDAVTYHATVSGGSGSNVVTWTGNPAISCATGLDCLIDPSDALFCAAQKLFATVTDGNPLCGSKDSTEQTYTKVTAVTATSLP